jgi:hypothetical protein
LISSTNEPLQLPLLSTIPPSISKDAIKSFDELLLYAGIRNGVEVEEKLCGNQVVYSNLAASFINRGVGNPSLRDEIYCQLMKQLTNNQSKFARDRLWGLLYLTLHYFLPSKHLERFLIKFLYDNFVTYIFRKREEDIHVQGMSRTTIETKPSSTNLRGTVGPKMPTRKEELVISFDSDSSLSAQMCLNILHINTLFCGNGSSYGLKKTGTYARDTTMPAMGPMVANQKTTLLLMNMKDRNRLFGTHLSYIMFHQVNRLRTSLLITNTPTNNELGFFFVIIININNNLKNINYIFCDIFVFSVARMNFELPPYGKKEEKEKPFVPLYQYYLPKFIVFLSMKVISLDGLNTEVCVTYVYV